MTKQTEHNPFESAYPTHKQIIYFISHDKRDLSSWLQRTIKHLRNLAILPSFKNYLVFF